MNDDVLIKNLSIICNQSERSLKNYQNALGMNGEELEGILTGFTLLTLK